MAKHIPHLFLYKEEIEKKILNEENFNHLINVLRLKKDEKFFALDNMGNQFTCVISSLERKSLVYDVLDSKNYKKPECSIKLVQAITKIETFENILNTATQLGVSEIYPMLTKYVTVSLDIFNKKLQRFNKILKSSSEQSQRKFLPVLKDVITFETFVKTFDKKSTLVAYEKAVVPMRTIFKNLELKDNIILVCGAEGGFSDEEAQTLIDDKFNLLKLSSNILRAETAVTVGLGNILYEIEK